MAIENTHANSDDQRGQFVRNLIDDIAALDKLISDDRFEKDIRRIGFEQEFCLMDYNLRPCMKAMEVLETLNDPHFTNELAKFNLEANLDPLLFKGRCLSDNENQMISLLTQANKAAHKHGAKIILTGILPTIVDSDIIIDNITPKERYITLNNAMRASRGTNFEFNIQGTDELITNNDTVLFESCNTSFQVHLQVHPSEFISKFNWAQAISGPILSIAANSPMFLGKRLWQETRIALFHQSTDMRKNLNPYREERPRVNFGYDWEKGSVVDMFRELVTRYKILVTDQIFTNSLEDLSNGITPKLKHLCLHNSTIYKWNRPCYGITNNKPHLRIESRYLPAGPTIVDEMANAALWLGVLNGMPDEYKNIAEVANFDDTKHNFMNAAKAGIGAQFKWLNNKLISAQDLLLNELIPIARTGLEIQNVDSADIDNYLGIITERVKSTQTGARWTLDSYNKLSKEGGKEEALIATTEGIYQRQKIGNPVHTWKLPLLKEGGNWVNRFWYVRQIMSTDLITIQDEEPIDLLQNIMSWSEVSYLPVENEQGKLCGIISLKQLLNTLLENPDLDKKNVRVADIMNDETITVSPDTPTIDAIQLMIKREITALMVVQDERLVGIFTQNDYLRMAPALFEELKSQK